MTYEEIYRTLKNKRELFTEEISDLIHGMELLEKRGFNYSVFVLRREYLVLKNNLETIENLLSQLRG